MLKCEHSLDRKHVYNLQCEVLNSNQDIVKSIDFAVAKLLVKCRSHFRRTQTIGKKYPPDCSSGCRRFESQPRRRLSNVIYDSPLDDQSSGWNSPCRECSRFRCRFEFRMVSVRRIWIRIRSVSKADIEQHKLAIWAKALWRETGHANVHSAGEVVLLDKLDRCIEQGVVKKLCCTLPNRRILTYLGR